MSVGKQEYDPASVITPESPPPAKRRRLESPETSGQNGIQSKRLRISDNKPLENDSSVVPKPNEKLGIPLSSKTPPTRTMNGLSQSAIHAAPASKQTSTSSSSSSTTNTPPRVTGKPLLSQNRPISPPSTARQKTTPPSQLKPKPLKAEELIPRKVQRDPVAFPQRVFILKQLHKQIDSINKKLGHASADQQSNFLLTEQEVIKQALDEEESAANSSPSGDGYKHAIQGRIGFFKGMDMSRWNGWVGSTWRATTPASKPTTEVTKDGKVKTGLANKEEEITIVKHLRTGLNSVAQYGWVIKAPTDQEIAGAKRALAISGGVETCDRCGTKFTVYPGRNSEGKFTSKGPCRYHWARAPHKRATSEGVYDCCGAVAGSEGCTVAEDHVFKVSDPKRLAALWQFETTPAPKHGKEKQPVTFDCEMCYTTKGMELVRLTAISWPEKVVLLDILVRPIGDLLDLNTRFSGVSKDLYYNAPSYGTRALSPPSQINDNEPPPLEKVASPLAARQLLFDFLDTETPLIGHAIDNDLNVCRIIHPFVIDTVLLFPHPRGLPIRYKLKDLAQKYLNRKIQTGNEEGHDSREDSEATGDLVLVKVAERWADMKRKGWYWKDGKLFPGKP